MSTIEIRPRFKRHTTLTEAEVLALFKEGIAKNEGVKGYIVDHHIYLSIPKEDQHFWSPQLAVELVDDVEGVETEIRSLFGPSPSVWMMYIFFYSLLGFLSMVVLIIGFSRWNLGLSAGILWFIPVLVLLIVLAIVTAKTGQKLGHDQMLRLYDFFNDTMGDEMWHPMEEVIKAKVD
jgi:hypothetical protein